MWLIYALVGAVGKTYSGFFRKKLAHEISASAYVWFSYGLIVLVMTPFMIPRAPELIGMIRDFPVPVLGAALSLIVATQLNMEALKREELSYIAPLNAFTTVFTLVLAMLFANEVPPSFGVIGVLAVFVGAYVVSIKSDRVHWYDPLKYLGTSTGAQLGLLVAFGYALNIVLMKVVSNQGYDALSIMYMMTLIGVLALMHVPFTKRSELRLALKSNKFEMYGGAVSGFVGAFFNILAIAGTFASYAVAVRRLDSLMSVALGGRYLKETNIRNKSIGAAIMTIGAVILVLS